jgi:GNAT superfamily N-acetyltransferase
LYTRLGEGTLKSGARLICGVVTAPDLVWALRIEPFLAHKQPAWRYHVTQSLREPLDQLETRFYLGTLEGEDGPVVTCVMVASARGVGLLGYVFTAPEYRQQGAYSQLMAYQMAHSRALGHHTLTLSTGFETTPYWIYHRFGFRSIDGTSGRMKQFLMPGAEARWFVPAPTEVHPMVWDDWPTLNLTALRVPAADELPEALPRSWALRVLDYGTAEGTFAEVFAPWARQPGRAARFAVTLRSVYGAVAGWALLMPDELTLGIDLRLDLYVHPTFRGDAHKLLEALPQPEVPVNAYTTGVESGDGFRATLLERAGFRRVTTLPGHLAHVGRRLDLHVHSRS